jgi:predicted adenine nucleotide alpha hydrolase (AANH) superfamily ATPase
MEKGKKKILVHTCCGACASHVLPRLGKDGFLPIVFFYNPQVENDEDFTGRLLGVKAFCEENDLDLIEAASNHQDIQQAIAPYKDHSSLKYIGDPDRYRRRRCLICNNLLIQKTVEQAKKLRLRHFTTTLLCSPYKSHDDIVELANEISLDYNINFYYSDFRKGYFLGRNYARNHQIHIPPYCGCLESKSERRLE